MRLRAVVLGLLLVAASAAALRAHDLFIKLDTFFLAPRSKARVLLLNGTFIKSESNVARDRVRDFRVVGDDTAYFPGNDSWHDRRDTTFLDLETGAEGTYVVGVSLRPNELVLQAKEFNTYLREEGILDILALRKQTDELEVPARERYSKHVKAIVQVGARRTTGHRRELGYPAEIVPIENPYSLKVGESLTLQCLVDGKPLVRQVVLAGYQRGRARPQRLTLRTNAQGLTTLRLTSRGRWYVKFVAMARVTGDALDYESKWATLTFEVK